MQVSNAKINKLRFQYLGEQIFWNEKVKNVRFLLMLTILQFRDLMRNFMILTNDFLKIMWSTRLRLIRIPSRTPNVLILTKNNVITLIRKYVDQVSKCDDTYAKNILE